MKKTEFLERLRQELNFLPEEELNEAMRYYDEYISEAGEDEEKVISEMGTPQKVANEFKNEYYDKEESSSSGEIVRYNTRRKGTSVWAVVLIAILAIGFGIPILQMIREVVPGVAIVCIIALIIILIVKVLHDRNTKNTANRMEYSNMQTCSDIKDINLNLGMGKFQIKIGDSFSVDTSMAGGMNVNSYVSNNTWFVKSQHPIIGSNVGIVVLTIPKGFHADVAKVKLYAGDVLVTGLSANKSFLEVNMGNMEANAMYSKCLNINCGMGAVNAACSMNGNVFVKNGTGSVNLRIGNKSDEFNYEAVVGMGSVEIDGKRIQVTGGKINHQIGAANDMNIKCGMGSVNVNFNV